jgi:hydroxyacylglutathione hydrolase
MLKVTPIQAFEDNYIWLLQLGDNAVVIDPGDAQPVLKTLHEHRLKLTAILITHHHHDHIDGVIELLTHYDVPVYAPAYRTYPFKHTPVLDDQLIELKEIGLKLQVMWTPGHTLDHIVYYSKQYLFCGDTLFSAGCGRLFEGTAQQMLESLKKIKSLPQSTQIFCTHEYTLKNIAFALTLDPNNIKLIDRKQQVESLRQAHLPSLPTTLALEVDTNPFLRCHHLDIIQNSGAKSDEELDVFTTIRKLRNNY